MNPKTIVSITMDALDCHATARSQTDVALPIADTIALLIQQRLRGVGDVEKLETESAEGELWLFRQRTVPRIETCVSHLHCQLRAA
jgi:hypothetical protein